MRIFSCLILVFSVAMFASAGYDEYRGITSVQAGENSAPEVVIKANAPEQFHNAMTYNWAYALLILIAGIFAYMVEGWLEMSDPLSSDFAGNKALDNWGDAMKKEEQRHRHPKQ
jgi:hypothetical protein